jgi:hypothetical protein
MNVHLTIHKDEEEYFYIETCNVQEWLSHKLNVCGWADEKVFLLSIHDNNDESHTTEILVTESIPMARYFVDDWFMTYAHSTNIVAHIMDFDSYEDAYAVALGMREIQPNCYNNEANV